MQHKYRGLAKFRTPPAFPCEIGEKFYVRDYRDRIVETWVCTEFNSHQSVATYRIENHD